ncbi:MAG: RND transporter, partial [Bacteroidetes bacterium]|nr:RND transporter [Bacteroidota bacterium]
LSGEVTSVANIGEQRPGSDSKVFEVIISINDSDTTLRPAMTTSNEIMVSSLDDAVYIPLECLHVQDSTTYVYKKVSDKVVKQEIFPGMMNENHVEIKAGIKMEDQVYLSIPADTAGLSLEKVSEKGISSVR